MLDIVGREYRLPDKVKALTEHGKARVVAMCNQKGGVGKTTSTISLGGALAELGRKTLIIDFDPQGAASAGLGINSFECETTIYELLFNPKLAPQSAIVETKVEGLDLIPANIDLSAAEVQLVSEVARENILKNILEQVRNIYDVIIIDCQPTLGLLTLNALTAADGVLIPLATEYFALRGVALLLDTIERVQERLNPKLVIDGVFPTMFDKRTQHAIEVVDGIYQRFQNTLMHTSISRTVKFPDSSVAAEPITIFAPTHAAAMQYRNLAKELIQRNVIR
jgi:chromosome partitioning protein